MIKIAFAFSMLALLIGCSAEDDASRSAEGSPQYRTGYSDGCDSGKRAAGNPSAPQTRDATSYENDKVYRDAWNDAFDNCRDLALREIATAGLLD